MPRDPFSGHLDMLLLAALQSRPMHGYAIIEYMRQASSGQFDYAEGTIYPALRRLEDDGLVRSRWSRKATPSPSGFSSRISSRNTRWLRCCIR